MPEYIKSPDGTVHVASQMGQAEFTFCARDMSYDGGDGGFDAVPVAGPATCEDCKAEIEKARRSIRGVRFI
jgi:hypothetical protein